MRLTTSGLGLVEISPKDYRVWIEDVTGQRVHRAFLGDMGHQKGGVVEGEAYRIGKRLSEAA